MRKTISFAVIVFEINGHFQQDETINLRFLNFKFHVIVFIQFCFANMICAFPIQTNHMPQHGPELEHASQSFHTLLHISKHLKVASVRPVFFTSNVRTRTYSVDDMEGPVTYILQNY